MKIHCCTSLISHNATVADSGGVSGAANSADTFAKVLFMGIQKEKGESAAWPKELLNLFSKILIVDKSKIIELFR